MYSRTGRSRLGAKDSESICQSVLVSHSSPRLRGAKRSANENYKRLLRLLKAEGCRFTNLPQSWICFRSSPMSIPPGEGNSLSEDLLNLRAALEPDIPPSQGYLIDSSDSCSGARSSWAAFGHPANWPLHRTGKCYGSRARIMTMSLPTPCRIIRLLKVVPVGLHPECRCRKGRHNGGG